MDSTRDATKPFVGLAFKLEVRRCAYKPTVNMCSLCISLSTVEPETTSDFCLILDDDDDYYY